ncbi:MAG: nickel pincer cofactor biosynthesis protein LarB [Oscillospiraceae bacterium]|jgi:NCAIR mutase (PurE)-related protein|nr:nickel pincer cofactor biosynthesis protein LarB [Oscillospiraceae bacterium]
MENASPLPTNPSRQRVLELLEAVRDGAVAPNAALERLRIEPFEDIGYAKIDYHRSLRQGAGEVIFGQNKTPEQIAGILRNMQSHGLRDVLVTRIEPITARFLADGGIPLTHHAIAKLAVCFPNDSRPSVGNAVVVSGGTSDMPICEEAALTLETLGSRVERLYDVGVAGLHRLLSKVEILAKARVVVAVAGMEGALASVVGGLVSCPVIAVPTSVGYGASFHGLAALLSMLNSCASGVSVVNIDNGFGAGFLAHRINTMEGLD